MNRLKNTLVLFLYSLYGIYAVVVIGVFLFGGGFLALIMPTLGMRKRVSRWTLRGLFFAAAMPYRVHGLARLPEGPCIVIANHRSYLDGLILIAALPPRFSAVIKHEIAEVAVLGWFLRRIGERFVEREPTARAGRDARRLLSALIAGESLAMFPEGTFSTDSGLLPFRDGAFYLASKASVPIVPVAIEGTRKILPEERFLPCPGVLSIRVSLPVQPDGRSRQAADRLRDRAEAVMSRLLKRRTPEQARTPFGYAYYCNALASLPLPQAYVDLNLLERNIRSLLKRSGGKKLRVDASLLRCPEIMQRVMRSNARFHGVRCMSIAEALYLTHITDLKDFLVAYPTLQTDALNQACAAIAAGHDITLTVDSPRHLEHVAQAAIRMGVVVPLCIEIDMSVAWDSLKGPGRRSPIRSADMLLQLVQAIDIRPGTCFRGVLTYDNYRNQLAEWLSPHNDDDDTAPTAHKVVRLGERRQAMADALRAHGHGDALVNCGGVSTVEFNAAHSAVTEITVGRALYGYDPSDGMVTPAVGYATEIIRQPDHDRYACQGEGAVVSMVASRELLPQPYLPWGASLDALQGSGVEQLPIRYEGHLELGSMIFLHPLTTAAISERFSSLQLIQDGVVVETADTYRL